MSIVSEPAPALLRPAAWWRTFGRTPRIMGLDVARALAVLGMVGAHVGNAPSLELLDPSTWGGIVHGRSAILFALLAGVSIVLMTARGGIPDPERMPQLRLRLLGRGIAIFVIGVALELLNTPVAVILTVYGLLYVVAIPFLRWSARRLLIAAAVLAVTAPPLLALLGALFLGPSAPGLDLAVFGTYPITAWLALVLAGMAIGRMDLTRVATAVCIFIVGLVLCVLGYGVGAAADAVAAAGDEYSTEVLSAEDLDAGASAAVVFAEEGEDVYGVPAAELDFAGMLCDSYEGTYISCYPAEDAAVEEEWVEEDEPLSAWPLYAEMLGEYEPLGAMGQALVSASPHSAGTAEIVGSGGFAAVVIGLCLLLSRILRWPLLPLAALGSMPLTAYSAHLVAMFALVGPGALISDPLAWAGFAVVLVVGATLWAMLFGRGPLERLVGWVADLLARGR